MRNKRGKQMVKRGRGAAQPRASPAANPARTEPDSNEDLRILTPGIRRINGHFYSCAGLEGKLRGVPDFEALREAVKNRRAGLLQGLSSVRSEENAFMGRGGCFQRLSLAICPRDYVQRNVLAAKRRR